MISKSNLYRIIFLVVILLIIAAVIFGVVSGTGPNRSQIDRSLFEQFVVSGGPIVWFVLLPMSLLMVYLAIDCGLLIRRNVLLPDGIGETIAVLLTEITTSRKNIKGDDLISTAAKKAVETGSSDWFRIRTTFEESLQDQAIGLFRRIEWLNLIGNVSPMIGLFGTVFGMIKLFNAIVIAGGQPQPVQLADGISVALVTTFWGLFIAIPALALHGIFRNKIETLANDAVNEIEVILKRLKTSPKKIQPPQSHLSDIEELPAVKNDASLKDQIQR